MKSPLLPLVGAIAAISIVGVGLSLTIPLISVRMEAAGFSGEANGLGVAMSGLATILVSPAIPALVRLLGVRNILMLALATGIASLAAIAFIDNIYWWYPIRFVFSCALTVLFVVSEYAINALAPQDRRGFWVGVYSTSLYLGFAAGPAILGLVGTDGRLPFFVAVALFAIAGAPILAAGSRIPGFTEKAGAPALSLLTRAPALMLAALLFGAVETSAMGLLPVHALRNGFDAQTGAMLVTVFAFGNVVFQVPVGIASDRFDRNRLIVVIALIGLVGALVLLALGAHFLAFSIALFVWGGFAGGLYMLGLAELGARYKGADLASANSVFVMLYASGMIVGPPALGKAMDFSPRYGLFGGVAALFALYLVMTTANRPAR
ncbi:MAG: MFS transporter [Beijerinckiaceae bacterium]